MTAGRFLMVLGGRFTFQTFGEGDAKRNRALSRILHGTLTEHADTLSDLNARGAGVFVMVNEGDGRGRTAKNVKRVRALFVDLDGAPLEAVQAAMLQPHCVIQTSPGRWHAYWRVSDCRLDQFASMQRALAVRFNGDTSVSDLPRVMRMPGFEHRKHEPFTSLIVSLREDSAPYTLDALVRNLDLGTPPPQAKQKRKLPGAILEGERNVTLLSLAGGLVRKGHDAHAVRGRLQQINTGRCLPPLCANEIDTITTRAVEYGSEGFTILPHKLLDSPEWKSLPPAAHDVIVVAFRRYDATNNGDIALTWEDFDGLPGFSRKQTFYRHRRRALASGILLQTYKGGNSQRGKKPDLFAIAERWLRNPPVSIMKPRPCVANVHP